jgi:hypothetical protein
MRVARYLAKSSDGANGVWRAFPIPEAIQGPLLKCLMEACPHVYFFFLGGDTSLLSGGSQAQLIPPYSPSEIHWEDCAHRQVQGLSNC